MNHRKNSSAAGLLALTALIAGCATDRVTPADPAASDRSRADVKAEAIAASKDHHATLTESEESILKK